MEVINLIQSTKGYKETQIIEAENDKVIFALCTRQESEYFYQIRKRNKKGEEKLLWCYEMPEDYLYMQKVRMEEGKIILVGLEEEGKVKVSILNEQNSEVIQNLIIDIDGRLGEVVIFINSKYFFVGAEGKEETVYFLCDINQGKSFEVKDKRFITGMLVCHELIACFPKFKYQGEEYIVYNECYMEDYEYEQMFEYINTKTLNANSIKEKEGIYIIPIEQLVTQIKQQIDISWQCIKVRDLDGWIRYLWIKDKSIYYREKDFKTQIETIFRLDIETLEESAICQINHTKLQGKVIYSNGYIYEDIRGKEKHLIKGYYGLTETLSIPTHKKMSFEAFLENHYIITSWWWEREINNIYEYKEFVGIQEKLPKGQKDRSSEDNVEEILVYGGRCYIKDDFLIIY